MKKNLILTTVLLISGYAFSMEEREKPIDPNILAQINKLPANVGEEIKELSAFENLPADLLLPILVKFVSGDSLTDSFKAMKQFRLISHRFNDLIKDKVFITSMINYWSEKYKVPRLYIPVAWSLTLEDIPDELLMLVLTELKMGKSLKDEIAAINRFRLVSKKFNRVVNNIKFVTDMINYWSQKYKIDPAFIAVLWNIPGVLEWVKLQDKSVLDIIFHGKDKSLSKWQAIKDWESSKVWEKKLNAYAKDKPLHWAVKLGRLDLIPILIKKGVDIEEDVNGTPLILAIKRGSTDLVKILLENGADPNKIDKHGNLPLISAIANGSWDLVKILVENGADPNKSNSNGDLPLFEAIIQRALFLIGSHGYEEVIKLLLENGAELNKTNPNGETPLVFAIKLGLYETTNFLLENGADPNKGTVDGSPLQLISKMSRDIGNKIRRGSYATTSEFMLYRQPEKFIELLKKYGAKE